MTPSWRYSPERGHTLAFLGHVDDRGNLYVTDTVMPLSSPLLGTANDEAPAGSTERLDRVSVTRVLSLTPAGAVRFSVQVAESCTACITGLEFSIDSPGRRLFFSAQGRTFALSTDDGRELWSAATTAGLPPNDVLPDGGAVFSVRAPFLVGSSVVVIPVMEGDDDHHSYVQAFDRQSGAFRWQFHRKGHFYGMGVAGDELWTSSADCWAIAGEMARIDQLGQVQLNRFVEWIPSIYGPRFALGIARGKLHRMDAAFNLADLSPLPPSDRLLTAPTRMALWYQGTLQSVSFVDDGLNDFVFRGVMGFNPDFELLSGGKIGWTASLPPFAVPGTGGYLGAVDAAGQELFQCPLSSNAESPTAIIKGRAYMASQGDIVAYDVPGLDVEPEGWVARHGSLGR